MLPVSLYILKPPLIYSFPTKQISFFFLKCSEQHLWAPDPSASEVPGGGLVKPGSWPPHQDFQFSNFEERPSIAFLTHCQVTILTQLQ